MWHLSNDLDMAISRWVNQFAAQSYVFDIFVKGVQLELLRSATIVALLCWAYWATRRSIIDQDLSWLRITVGITASIVVSRALQNWLPARLRPMHEPTLDFVLPFGVDENSFVDWSSFPSDHAVLFAAMSVAVWKLDRRIGWLAAAWTLFVTLLPRVYLGIHYPGDILVGAVIGVAIMLIAWRLPMPKPLYRWLADFESRHRGVLAAALFLLLYVYATMFHDIRAVLSWFSSSG